MALRIFQDCLLEDLSSKANNLCAVHKNYKRCRSLFLLLVISFTRHVPRSFSLSLKECQSAEFIISLITHHLRVHTLY